MTEASRFWDKNLCGASEKIVGDEVPSGFDYFRTNP